MKDQAITFEALKYALRQNKDGVVLSLVIHPNDVQAAILSDPIGSHYQIALVKIGEDKPVSELNMGTSALDAAKRGIIASAGVLCRDQKFQHWMFKRGMALEDSEAGAVQGLRKYLGVGSRVQLADNQKARQKFMDLRQAYEKETEE